MSEPDLAEESDVEYPFFYVIRHAGRHHLGLFAAAVLLTIVAAVNSNLSVYVIGVGFDSVFSSQPLTVPLVPDTWVPTSTEGQLWFVGGFLTVSGTVGVFVAIGKNVLWELFGQRVVDDVRVQTFDSAQHQELAFFDTHQTGDVMSALNDDVNTLERGLSKSARWAVGTSVTLLSALAFMAYLNWQLTAVVFLLLPILAAINIHFSRALSDLYPPIQRAEGRLNARMESTLGGMDVVKANAAEGVERERFTGRSGDLRDKSWTGTRKRIQQTPLVQGVTGLVLVVVMIVGGLWVIDGPPLFFTGTLTVGQLVPFLFYMRNMEGGIEFLSALVGIYQWVNSSAARIVGVRNADDRVTEDTDAQPVERVDGDVAYEDVTFSYPGTDEAVVDSVSFDVEPGETVGIVGSTGAGKSTLIKLLLRFYEPDDGVIRLDGRDVTDVSRQDLRAAVGYVDQESFLFDGTVAENVAYGEEGVSHEEVVAAAREAGAHEFVADLEDGYETHVGQRGVKLSGGQRQRVAIARALVRDPSVLVFDEATSHVDNETEVLIRRNLAEITADRTTFVIAHRLSTVRDADRILVLDDGQLVEEGTHDELLAEDGTYADLWRVQVGEVDQLPDEFLERVGADD
ncbi:ABC transporter ATP-binding protein [Halosimplex litoreum]|uniref:ABC transporter ATP-binding protein n=1 Tax=Halosimplex litoreum TaxID=1198301 RepID=A0A7T3KWN8_9EURY|nr:ABC transporter ATP-binding protein [Halosimplex litoreum]QPV64273.1 ABC transporter ATP-binding protein [Halosimplex litoreum]